MVPGVGVAGDVLPEDDLPQVVRPGVEPGRHQPGEHHQGPEKEAAADPQPLQLLLVAGDREEGEDREQRRQQADRPLGQGGDPADRKKK